MPVPGVVGTDETRQHIGAGIDAIANLLAATLGPKSGYVVHTRPNNELEILDDAAIIARRILGLQNPRNNVGAMMMRHLVWRVGSETGDGGAIAAVLMQAIYHHALRLMVAGYHPVLLEKGIQKATDRVIEALYGIAQPIKNENQLVKIAQSVIQDDELAVIVGEMRYLLGADGKVMIRDYTGRILRRRYIAGTHVAANALSRDFFAVAGKREVAMNRVALAISNARLWEAEDALNLMKVAVEKGAENLLIITPEISNQVLNILIANHRSDDVKLKIFAVQVTEEGLHHSATLEDLCVLTRSTLLGKMQIHTPASATVDDLGYVPRISFEDKMLTVLTGKNASPDLEAEIGSVRRQLDNLLGDDNEKREFLVKRLARLTGGVGELKLGAISKQERNMLNHQAERALKVLAVAQRGGAVAGGGAGFIHARHVLTSCDNPDMQVGYNVVYRALEAPIHHLLCNGGHPAPGIVIDALENGDPSMTYDVMLASFADSYADGLIDPVDVLVTGLQKASSMAVRALMTDAIVFHRDPQQEGNEP